MCARRRLDEEGWGCQVAGCPRLPSSLPVEAMLPSGVSLWLEVCSWHAEELEREFGDLVELGEEAVAS